MVPFNGQCSFIVCGSFTIIFFFPFKPDKFKFDSCRLTGYVPTKGQGAFMVSLHTSNATLQYSIFTLRKPCNTFFVLENPSSLGQEKKSCVVFSD